MGYTIEISSTNYSGFTAYVNFTGTTGNTIDLGTKLIPFEINSENPYGTYELYFSSYNKTCSFEIPNPTSTPTPSITPTYTPTPTIAPTNTPTPSITPSVTPSQGLPPFTGYGFNLVDAPYAPPSSGNTLFTNFGSGGVLGITNPNTFVTNGVYWSYIDNTGTDRSIFFNGLTTGNNLISFTHNSNTVIYSANSNSFFFDNDNLNVFYNPFLEPGNLVLVESSPSSFVIGEEVQINFSGL